MVQQIKTKSEIHDQFRKKLSPKQRDLYYYLRDHEGMPLYRRQIANDTGMCIKTIERGVRLLKELNYIEVQSNYDAICGTQLGNTYRILKQDL